MEKVRIDKRILHLPDALAGVIMIHLLSMDCDDPLRGRKRFINFLRDRFPDVSVKLIEEARDRLVQWEHLRHVGIGAHKVEVWEEPFGWMEDVSGREWYQRDYHPNWLTYFAGQ